MSRAPLPRRTCECCGRTFAWRRKWARDWENVRYCSDRCRRSGTGAADRRLEACILDRLGGRPGRSTTCPSEIARTIDPADWRDHLEAVRCAARRLVAAGRLEFLQNGRAVDPDTARGPIRLRLVRDR
ncbi:MAG: hypothetical protein CMJ54_09835 [Planctomycetaceae bacterium]|nr:hypothetical protein [Planctomycetaceae bacterium]